MHSSGRFYVHLYVLGRVHVLPIETSFANIEKNVCMYHHLSDSGKNPDLRVSHLLGSICSTILRTF